MVLAGASSFDEAFVIVIQTLMTQLKNTLQYIVIESNANEQVNAIEKLAKLQGRPIVLTLFLKVI